MKNSKSFWVIGGLLLVVALVVAMPFGYNRFMKPNYRYNPMDIDEDREYNYGPDMMEDGEYPNGYGPGMMGDSGYQNGYGPGMMMWGNGYQSRENKNMEKISVQEVEEIVEEYLNNYNEDLEIGDIFVFVNTDYYVSIEEVDTGRGAMELLVNPYSGVVYPETGPNMMWNEKYNMMGTGFRDNNEKNISRDEAVKIANEYVNNALGNNYSVPNEGHEFYGYYTFHVNQDDNAVGMLSVNYATGDIWYHTWHGELEQVISKH